MDKSNKNVMEWSGRCCRHIGKRETTAGSVQQQQDFIFADQTSTKTTETDTHTAKHTVSAGRKAS